MCLSAQCLCIQRVLFISYGLIVLCINLFYFHSVPLSSTPVWYCTPLGTHYELLTNWFLGLLSQTLLKKPRLDRSIFSNSAHLETRKIKYNKKCSTAYTGYHSKLHILVFQPDFLCNQCPSHACGRRCPLHGDAADLIAAFETVDHVTVLVGSKR